jgi:hypothetical protein
LENENYHRRLEMTEIRERTTEQLGPFSISIVWERDSTHGPAQHLGCFTDDVPTTRFYVDVKSGAVIGPVEKVVEIYPKLGYHREDVKVQATEYLYQNRPNDRVIEVSDYQVGPEEVQVTAYVRPVWDWVFNQHTDRERKYYRPAVENYAGIPDEEVLRYVKQDYKRLVGLYNRRWRYRFCTVEVYVGNLRVGVASLHGVESDAEEAYFEEVETDLVAEAMRSINLETLTAARALLARTPLDRAVSLLRAVDDPADLLA